MVDIEFIRKKRFLDGWSIRKISRQLGVSRQVVRKALRSAEIPRYRLSKPRLCPVMDAYRELILTWLGQDEKAPPKQRHTARRIYDRLCQEYGFKGAESTVRGYVQQLRQGKAEVFIPLTAGWGEQAQVDWGEARVRIAGQEVKAHIFNLCLRASGVRFVWASPTEKLEAFLEGHCRAFSWLGGVPKECLYDNPKTAVLRILAGPEREEHSHFASLRAHFLFDSLFCRPAEAHEKGAVENSVGYCRRNALVPVPEQPSWQTLNDYLLGWCGRERERLADKWAAEKAALRPLPAQPFQCCIIKSALVSRLSLVRVDHNRYSVPSDCHLASVRVKLFTDHVDLCQGEEVVASHCRCHARGQSIMSLDHYLPALERKPHAVSHAAVVRQLPAVYNLVREKLCSARPDGYREFAAILLLHREFPAQALETALQQAWERGCLQASSVRQILLNQSASPKPEPVAVPLSLRAISVQEPDLRQYDLFLPARQVTEAVP